MAGELGTSEDLSVKSPILVIGIGSMAKIARQASITIGCDCLLVSNDKKDLGDERSIYVNSGAWVNPSGYKLRSFLNAKADQLAGALEGFETVIVISNLAGRAGAAMAPVVCSAARQKNAVIISFAIMPFGFEKDRLFAAGVALRRIREYSNSTIVMDNDAFLDNNPELSKEECYSLTNSAIVEVASSVASRGVRPDMNVLATSVAQGDSEKSLRDSASMLYRDVANPETIRRAVVYVMGGDKLSINALSDIVSCAKGIFKEEGTTEVSMSSMAATDGVRVHLVASAPKTRFDAYDPLSEIIPLDSQLDWDEPDSAPEIKIALPLVEL